MTLGELKALAVAEGHAVEGEVMKFLSFVEDLFVHKENQPEPAMPAVTPVVPTA